MTFKIDDDPLTPERLDKLKIAFDLVADPKDWRAPINAVVLVEARDAVGVTLGEIAAAIVHYTATKPDIFVLTVPAGAVVFRAEGYRAGPAGP